MLSDGHIHGMSGTTGANTGTMTPVGHDVTTATAFDLLFDTQVVRVEVPLNEEDAPKSVVLRIEADGRTEPFEATVPFGGQIDLTDADFGMDGLKLLVSLFSQADGRGAQTSGFEGTLSHADMQEHPTEGGMHGGMHGGGDHSHGHGEITDNNAFLMAMGAGSRIEMHGADREKQSWAQLDGHGEGGDDQITVTADTGWEVGDRIAVAASGKRGHDDPQDNAYEITGVSEDGKTLTLDKPLIGYSHGAVQPHSQGDQSWEVDMRAEVGLLSRNVKIQGDEDSSSDGYGGHTMIMHGAKQHISGTEFFRMGQLDEMGRYPIHWHMNGDASGQYVENSSVHESFNKGMTVHGTHNTRLEDNTIFNHIGHGVFLEDGSEHGSQILGNLVFGTQKSQTGEPIPTDQTNVSSYWIENGNTVMIGNHAAGSEDIGFWITPAFNGPHGLSADVYTDADHTETWGGSLSNLVFRDNVAHSNRDHGLFTEKVIDKETLEPINARSGPGELLVESFTAYSNGTGLWAGSRAFIDDSVFSGNDRGTFFHNDSSVVHDSLYVGDNDNPDAASGQTGAFLYRNADGGFDDVHFENFTGAESEAFNVRTGTQATPTWVNGLSFDTVDVRVTQDDRADQDSPWASDNRIVDLDGSLTGEAGTFVTRTYLNEQFGGFDTETDARFEESFLTKGGFLFMTRIQHQAIEAGDGSPTSLLVTREDGVRYAQFEDEARNVKTMQTAGDNARETAYLVEFDALPRFLNINAVGMREGASVVYQIPNYTGFRVSPEDAATVTSLDQMFAADQTAIYHDGNTIFLRVVAQQIDETGRADHPTRIDAMIDNADSPAQAFLTDIGAHPTQGVRLSGLEAVDGAERVDRGEAEFDPEMMALLAQTDGPGDDFDVPELEAPQGLASPTYFARDTEMTEAQALADIPDTQASAQFDITYDNDTNIARIEGTFANLNSDVTMMHLHDGAPDVGGSVIGGLTLNSTDARNGTFTGEIALTDAQEAALLAGNTYVNLHTQDVPGGALRGQVDVTPSRQSEPIQHDSTSRTTEITDDLPRWSDPQTWGGTVPDGDSHVVIHEGMRVVLDQSATVSSILVDGGELLVEDARDVEVVADWVLVQGGGLFQVGTETAPFEHDFTLTLDGDDAENDVDIAAHVNGSMYDTIHAGAAMPEMVSTLRLMATQEPDGGPDGEPNGEPGVEPIGEPIGDPGPVSAPPKITPPINQGSGPDEGSAPAQDDDNARSDDDLMTAGSAMSVGLALIAANPYVLIAGIGFAFFAARGRGDDESETDQSETMLLETQNTSLEQIMPITGMMDEAHTHADETEDDETELMPM